MRTLLGYKISNLINFFNVRQALARQAKWINILVLVHIVGRGCTSENFAWIQNYQLKPLKSNQVCHSQYSRQTDVWRWLTDFLLFIQ